jgi:sec-independent protein translocase protein TatA
MGNIGFKELLVILVIVLLIFGARRIPQIMRNMAEGVKEFKKGLEDKSKDDSK